VSGVSCGADDSSSACVKKHNNNINIEIRAIKVAKIKGNIDIYQKDKTKIKLKEKFPIAYGDSTQREIF
jgi:hypothetical protein